MGQAMVLTLTAVLCNPVWAQTPATSTATQQDGSTGPQVSSSSIAPGEQEVGKLSEQGRKAELAGDPSFMQKHLAASYRGVGPSGMVLTKEMAIAECRDGVLKFTKIEPQDTKITANGKMALITNMATVGGSYHGRDIAGTYRVSEVWMNENGVWQEVYSQVTQVQSDAATPRGQ